MRQDFLRHSRELGAAMMGTVVIFVTTSCHNHQLPNASLVSVRIAPVEALATETESRYSAVIAPLAQVDLGFKSPGVVAGIRQVRSADGRTRSLGAGDRVQKGAELAHVRGSDYQQAIDQAQAQVLQAQAQIVDATAAYENSQLNWDRSRSLYESGSLVKPQYDQAKSGFTSAEARVSMAKAALASSNAGLAHTRLGLADTFVCAPFTGWVTARNVEIGTVASVGAVAFSMIDTHLVKANFAVPDVALASVHLGSQYSLQLDILDTPVRGTVTAISQQSDPKTHVFTVELTLPNSADLIRPGMISTIRLKKTEPSALHSVVPLNAVVRPPSQAGGFAVYVIEERDGKQYARARTITVGQTYGNSIEVLSGLTAGEPVVAVGAALLQDGQEVRVVR